MTLTIDDAVKAAREGDYLSALNIFLDVYGTDESPPIKTPKSASGLSWFGLCLVLMRKQTKSGIDLCRRAIELEFYNGDHYANLARVYTIAGNRKKAVETADQGLKQSPHHPYLIEVRKSLGIRSRPAVPFLERGNPINVSLGQARHAKKVAEREAKKKK